MAFKLGGKSGLPMKRSGFKMRTSPFQRNMGIGVSPVKNLGIKPVFDDGTVGDNVSSAEAKRMLKSGEIQEIIKTGDDAIVSNIEEQKDLVEGGSKNATDAPGEVDEFLEEGVLGPNQAFGGREFHEKTGGKTGLTSDQHGSTDYDAYVGQYGQELADADREIQNYLNTNGSAEGMPEHLVEAQAKIKDMDQKLFDRQKNKSEGSLRFGGTFDNSNFGENVEGEEMVEYPLRREALGVDDLTKGSNATTNNFQDVEVASGGDGADLTSQESGTKEAAEKERLRLEREAEIKAEEKAASKAASQLELDNMRENRSNEKAANEAQYADYKDTEPDYDPTSKRSRKKYKEWTDNAPDGFFDSYQ